MQAAGGEAARIKPQAHRVLTFAEDNGIADTGNTLDGVLDVNVNVVGDERLRKRLVRRDEAYGKDEVRIGFGDRDAGVVDDGRKTALD